MTKKIIASFVGLTMALTMVPGIVQGDTIEDLQAQIATLMAQITALNAQIAGLTGTTPATGIPTTCMGVTFTRNLSQGSDGSDVKCLQALLNTNPATQVATTGAGSPNNETNYFGPLTRAAVVKFQNLYAAEILTPIGLTAGTGYVGTMTRAKLNAMLTTPVTPTPDPTPDPDPDPVDPEEGYLEVRVAPEPVGVEIAPGQTKAVVAFEMEAHDSDIIIERIDLFIDSDNLDGQRPWRVMEYIALYDGDKAIMGKDAVSANFTADTGNFYRIRFSGLNVRVTKDSTKDLAVHVTLPAVMYPAWIGVVEVEAEARYVDTVGIRDFAYSADTAEFEVVGELATSLEVKRNTDSPEQGVALVSDDSITRDVELLIFDIKAKDAAFTVEEIRLAVTEHEAISRVKLYDGTTLLKTAIAGATPAFTNLEIEIAADATKVLSVKVDVPALIALREGAGVSATVTRVDGEDELYNPVSETVNVVGRTQSFFTSVPVANLAGHSITVTGDNPNQLASASMEIDITARGGDVYFTETESIEILDDPGVWTVAQSTFFDDFDVAMDDAVFVLATHAFAAELTGTETITSATGDVCATLVATALAGESAGYYDITDAGTEDCDGLYEWDGTDATDVSATHYITTLYMIRENESEGVEVDAVTNTAGWQRLEVESLTWYLERDGHYGRVQFHQDDVEMIDDLQTARRYVDN